VCQLNAPNACRDNGICIRGIPEREGGRCVLPCGPSGACDPSYQCLTVQFQGGGSGDYCFPRSNDCSDPGNVTELELGQRCNGSQPCASGLTCVGICAPSCAAGESCPQGWACETRFEEGAYCLPSVTEAQDCSGFVTCSVGPCLRTQSGQATCFRDCAGDPDACNSAQACNTYNLQGGGQVSICEPPGAQPPPPMPDAGVPMPDAGMSVPPDAGTSAPDAGATPDAGGAPQQKPQNACACDTTFACDPDPDGDPCPCDFECNCPCDRTFSCDPGCQACDPECICACDQTFACDPGCEVCDPECEEDTSSCACVAVPAGVRPTSAAALLLAGLGLARRRRRGRRPW
jgi:hypothetical protein